MSFFLACNVAQGEESCHVQITGAVIHISRCHVLSSFVSCGGGEAPPPRCLVMCSHPDCLTFSALALRLQFTYAAFHRFACDGCYHARTDGGEYLPLSSPYSPATKPGCSAKAGGQWQKVRCLIEYSVFKLHTRRRAEAVTGSGAGAHPEKMPSLCRH